ncbi:MAG: type II toxin-antitoxin system prevent-host-death family antitoxin [Candidatus Veblenbacteria bacterium]|nr:type II toxin-antitoxin system prevent-host-death family antitoxin [Candidatus Veblenbacteria bacterium]
MDIVGLKELKQNVGRYAGLVQRGQSFVVVKRSKPLFKLTPLEEDDQWEAVADFTKVKRGGLRIQDLLKRL